MRSPRIQLPVSKDSSLTLFEEDRQLSVLLTHSLGRDEDDCQQLQVLQPFEVVPYSLESDRATSDEGEDDSMRASERERERK